MQYYIIFSKFFDKDVDGWDWHCQAHGSDSDVKGFVKIYWLVYTAGK